MRRCLEFLDSKAQWWRAQASRRLVEDVDILSGLKAYSEKQALLFESLAFDFASNWLTVIDDCGLPSPTTWADKFLHFRPAPIKKIRTRRSRNKLISRVLNVKNILDNDSSATEALGMDE